MQTSNEIISYLPEVLPSIQEASQKHEIITSDHAPVLMEIPLPQLKEKIKVLSWNVLGTDTKNGFASSEEESQMPTYGENADQICERYLRLGESLSKMVENHSPDLITLQKIPPRKEESETIDLRQCFLDRVINKFSNEYNFILFSGGNERSSACTNLTLYKKYRLELKTEEKIDNSDISEFIFNELEGITSEFIHKGNQENVKVTNVHPNYAQSFSKIEESIDAQLKLENEKQLSVVVGSYDHPLDQEQENQNSTTSVSAKLLSKQFPKVQGAGSTDGGFYSLYFTQNNQEKKQAKIQIVDPKTGNLLTKEQLKKLEPTHPSQKQEVSELRPVLLIDDKTKATVFFVSGENKKNFSQLEQDFASFGTFNTPCKFRVARDINGTHGIAVEVSEETYEKSYFLDGMFGLFGMFRNEWGYFLTCKGAPESKELWQFQEFLVKMKNFFNQAKENNANNEQSIVEFSKKLHLLSEQAASTKDVEKLKFVRSLKLVLQKILKNTLNMVANN